MHDGQTSLSATRVLVSLLFLAGGALAQPSPQDRERQVNTFTSSAQSFSGIASEPQGSFVVVWQSLGSTGSDTSLFSIQAQRYDRLGRKAGSQIQVNTFTSGNQRLPSVGMDAQGRFVVVWDSDGSSGGDTSLRSIQGQRFAADGSLLGAQFQVNTYTPGEQYAAAVAKAADGHFLVVWTSAGSPQDDSISSSIQARRFDVDGGGGSQFQVNSVTSGPQELPAVGVNGEGDFLVSWKHNGADPAIEDPLSVQARRVAGSGAPTGVQFQVNSYTAGIQTLPAVAGDGEGNFLVAWRADQAPGPDVDPPAIEAAVFNSLGGTVIGEFQANTYTAGKQDNPRVAMSADGDFIVAWSGDGSAGSDTAPGSYSVHAQRYDADGTERDPELQANSWTTSDQKLPAVAMDAAGNFVLVWESTGSFDDDSSGTSIQQRRFDGLFRDGFESNGTSRWSQTVP